MPGLLGRGDKGLRLYAFTPNPLSSPVSLPDTLHCGNISVISTASCNKDYPGCLLNTMVCAGVEGGGTDSCEVRAERERWKEEGGGTGLEVGMGRVACFGPEDMLGGGGCYRFGDGEGRAVRMGVRLQLGSERCWGWGGP